MRSDPIRTDPIRFGSTQLMGGLALHEGKLAEMATGEGKTLVATLPCYLNALAGKGTVLVVTANDYLARRDAETMGQVCVHLFCVDVRGGTAQVLLVPSSFPFSSLVRGLPHVQHDVSCRSTSVAHLAGSRTRAEEARALSGMVGSNFN